jgi:glutaredoxin
VTRSSEPLELTLLERPGCHLCEDAARALEALQARRSFRLVRINIEADRELEDRYTFEIPVVLIGEREITKAPLDMSAVEAVLDGV